MSRFIFRFIHCSPFSLTILPTLLLLSYAQAGTEILDADGNVLAEDLEKLHQSLGQTTDEASSTSQELPVISSEADKEAHKIKQTSSRSLRPHSKPLHLFDGKVKTMKQLKSFQRERLAASAKQIEKEERAALKRAEEWAKARSFPMRGKTNKGKDYTVIRIENDQPIYYVPLNSRAADTLSSDEVYPGGSAGLSLTGTNITIGIWEAFSGIGSQIRTTHQEFANGRVTQKDTPFSPGISHHATWVAGTLSAAGLNANARGMSYKAKLWAYDAPLDQSEMATAALEGLRLSNHSYGSPGSYGSYFFDEVVKDGTVYNANVYLPVTAAGNDGEGSDTIYGGGPVAKNLLTVGSVGDVVGGYTHVNQVQIVNSSSRGPTDDGRIKPDLVGNGQNLTTTDADHDADYRTAGGTSLASPNVAGSLGLLMELYDSLYGTNLMMLASTLKGIAIHTADESGGALGPDYTYGWGLMNTLSGARIITNNFASGSRAHIKEVFLLEGDYVEFPVTSDGSEPLKVTICWSDYPGPHQASNTNIPPLALVNDLDLRIMSQSGTTNMPWVLNPAVPTAAATTGDNFRDNVEQVYLNTPSAGTYTVRVTHKDSLQEGFQYLSILVSGNIPQPKPELEIVDLDMVSSTNQLLDWPSIVGQLYCIEGSADLNGPWEEESGEISATRTNIIYEISPDPVDDRQFYRITEIY